MVGDHRPWLSGARSLRNPKLVLHIQTLNLKKVINMARQLFKRRKFCRFTAEGIKEIDYKSVDLLKDFIAENGKIILPASPAPRLAISVSCRPPSSAPVSGP